MSWGPRKLTICSSSHSLLENYALEKYVKELNLFRHVALFKIYRLALNFPSFDCFSPPLFYEVLMLPKELSSGLLVAVWLLLVLEGGGIKTLSETWNIGCTVTQCLTLINTHQWFSTTYFELKYIKLTELPVTLSGCFFSPTPPLIKDRTQLLSKLQYVMGMTMSQT
jgi:hypothetical protein